MRFVVGIAIIAVVSFFATQPLPASALGLKVAPLEYKSSLKEGERKQGVVDVSNPSTQAVKVAVSVQAFRQIDDNGGLQFYDDTQISAGIKPELQTLELGPREAIRLAFTIDGSVLPEGDIFAAIFFTTEPVQPRNGVGQLVRVGTLVSLVNKSPGQRSAKVSDLNLPFVQLDSTAKGTYHITNTGSTKSGFYPTVHVSSWPGGETQHIQSSLVFGGRERSNDFSYATGYGLHLVEVSFGGSKKSQWVVTVAPWMLVTVLLIVLLIGIELLLLKKRRKSRKKLPSKPASTSGS